MLQLPEDAAAAGGQRRHVGQRTGLVEDQAAALVVGARIEHIERHVAALLVVVRAPQQLGLLVRAQRGADGQAPAKHVAVLADLVHVAATRGHRARIERREAGEVVAVVDLGGHRAAEQVQVLVAQVDHGVAQLVLVFKLQPLDRARGRGARRQLGHRGIGGVVGVLLGLVLAHAQFDALLAVDAPAQLAAHVVNVGIEQVTLARLRRDAVSVGVIGAADMLRAQVERVVDRPLAAGEVLLDIGAEPLLAQPRQRGAQRHGGIRAGRAARRPRGDRDDAAVGAGAVDCAATAHDLDLLDVAGIDGGEVARRIPVGVERNAIHQDQRAAAAQCLAEVRDRAAGVRHARDQLAQHGREIVGTHLQFLDFLAFQHRYLARRADEVALDPVDPDLHRIQLATVGLGRRAVLLCARTGCAGLRDGGRGGHCLRLGQQRSACADGGHKKSERTYPAAAGRHRQGD
ncbi:hypothetical protein D9M72_245870 [compost metagenome]